MIFVIDRVMTATGETHERELRRKGHRVKIADVKIGYPLVAEYIDDGGMKLRTTRVTNFNENWRTIGYLVVRTKNSVYTFIEEAEASE